MGAAAGREAKRRADLGDLPLPLYFRIANAVKERILWGEWPAGRKLPTEEVLAQEYGVSRQTIRKAKDKLTAEGFVKGLQGSGCYVNQPEKWSMPAATVVNLDDVFKIGLGTTTFKVHEFSMVVNTEAIKDKLNNYKDEYAYQMQGVRYHFGQPISYVIYYLPYDIGSLIRVENLHAGPLIPQLENLAGIQVTEGVKTITLGRAYGQKAKLLNLRSGAAVLAEETIYVDQSGRPIEYLQTFYRDRLFYRIRVRRR